jgi:hypothetical protein
MLTAESQVHANVACTVDIGSVYAVDAPAIASPGKALSSNLARACGAGYR